MIGHLGYLEVGGGGEREKGNGEKVVEEEIPGKQARFATLQSVALSSSESSSIELSQQGQSRMHILFTCRI